MKMLPTLLLAFTLAAPLTLTQTLAAQAPPPDKAPDQLRTLSRQELDIIKVLTAQENAWNRGDLDGFLVGYKNSPDLLFVGEQVTRGFQPLLAHYRSNYPTKEAMGTLGFADLEPKVLDEHFAIIVGKYHLDRSKKMGGPADGLFSLVMEKTEAGWKIVVDHTT